MGQPVNDKKVNNLKNIWAHRKGELRQLATAIFAGFLATGIFAAFAPNPGVYIMFYTAILMLLGLLRLVYLLHPEPASLNAKWRSLAGKLEQLETQQKLYVRVAILFCISLILSFIADPIIAKPFAILTLGFVVYVACYDLLHWYRSISETLPGKAFIALAFAASSNLAYSLAGQKIANITHVTPNGFTHTILFMAILMIPVMMTLAGGVVFATGLLMSSLIVLPHMFKSVPSEMKNWLFAGTLPQETRHYRFATRIFQIIFYTSLGSVLYHFGGHSLAWYEKKTSTMASWLVFKYDMYASLECRIGDGYKIAPLGDAKFLIAREDTKGITFLKPIKCDDLPSVIE